MHSLGFGGVTNLRLLGARSEVHDASRMRLGLRSCGLRFGVFLMLWQGAVSMQRPRTMRCLLLVLQPYLVAVVAEHCGLSSPNPSSVACDHTDPCPAPARARDAHAKGPDHGRFSCVCGAESAGPAMRTSPGPRTPSGTRRRRAETPTGFDLTELGFEEHRCKQR